MNVTYCINFRANPIAGQCDLPLLTSVWRNASRKGGSGGGGWVNAKGANSMAMSEFRCRKALVGTEKAISVVFVLGISRET